ncbi:hypothetical protein NTGHW29_300026 [Candidatus Nitrotoga sp. HW29]|nr:hypothetical protein NTGHW29_300026 [Candidatus Nitrotoga sp. HW29]
MRGLFSVALNIDQGIFRRDIREVFPVPKAARNQFVGRVLKRFGYSHGRVDKGVLLRYVERMTGLSCQQVIPFIMITSM